MPITLQASSGYEDLDTTNATTHLFTPTNAAANGNLAIIVAVNKATATMSSVSGGGVTTWILAKESQNSTQTTTIMYGIANGTGGQITITWSAKAAAKAVTFGAFAGTKTTSILDVTGSAGATDANMLSGSTSGNTTDAGDLLIGAGGIKDAATFNSGPTNSFTNLVTPQTATSPIVVAAYRIATAIGTYSTDWTISQARAWAGAIASFFPAADAFKVAKPFIVRQAVNRAATY